MALNVSGIHERRKALGQVNAARTMFLGMMAWARTELHNGNRISYHSIRADARAYVLPSYREGRANLKHLEGN